MRVTEGLIADKFIYTHDKISEKKIKIQTQIATQLLEQGMELEKVRDFLGHEYLGTTQIYTRIQKQWNSQTI